MPLQLMVTLFYSPPLRNGALSLMVEWGLAIPGIMARGKSHRTIEALRVSEYGDIPQTAQGEHGMNESSYAQAISSLTRLSKRLQGSLDSEAMAHARDGVYRKFQRVFNVRHVQKSSADELRTEVKEFLCFKHNQHWTGLQRSGTVCSDMKKLREALEMLLDNESPIALRLREASGIKGMGVGIASAILHVAYPREYGVWNGKTHRAMKDLNIWPRFARGMRTEEQYVSVNHILSRLAKDLKTDLWNLDRLWHFHVEEMKRRKRDGEIRKKVCDDIASLEWEERSPSREGFKERRYVNHYERDPRRRAQAVKIHGTKCMACGFDFSRIYGPRGEDYIEVHHLKPVSEVEAGTRVSPKNDMAVVCSSCHRMIHRRKDDILTIEQLRSILRMNGTR